MLFEPYYALNSIKETEMTQNLENARLVLDVAFLTGAFIASLLAIVYLIKALVDDHFERSHHRHKDLEDSVSFLRTMMQRHMENYKITVDVLETVLANVKELYRLNARREIENGQPSHKDGDS